MNAATTFNTSTTSNSASSGPVTLDSIRQLMSKFLADDLPVLIRASPHAYFMLKSKIPPAIGEIPPLLPGITLGGLPCEIDYSLWGMNAEVDYRSGKIKKFDLSK